MRVMVLVKATKDSEAGVMPSQQLLTEMGRYNEELVKAGIMLDGEGSIPAQRGAGQGFRGRTGGDRRAFRRDERTAGRLLALAGEVHGRSDRRGSSAAQIPHNEECEIEIRPVFEAEDFGEAFTPELREQEERVLTEAKKLRKS